MTAFAVLPTELRAQTVEVTPFIGYRTGNDFLGTSTGGNLDHSGASSLGVVVDVLFGPPTDGIKVEGIFSRQRVQFVDVDHAQVGGIYELSDGRARPFLAALVGFTRYASPADTQFRLCLGGGAGVKLFATPHIGLRVDGRVYSTFVDTAVVGLCGGNGCAFAFRVSPAWQFDATAGIIVAF